MLPLLSQLCHTPASEDALCKLKNLTKGEQEELLTLARKQGLLPFLYVMLKNEKSAKAILKPLTDAYYGTIPICMQLAKELTEVCSALVEANISYCLIKGIVLTEELFGNIASYPSRDIDLFIQKEDIEQLHTVLKTIGYTPTSASNEKALEEEYSISFKGEGKRPLDIHYHLGEAQFFDIPASYWWKGIRNFTFQHKEYQMLQKEKMLLFASLHLFGHGFVPFKFLLAFSKMLSLYGKEISVIKLIEDAQKYNILIPFLLCCYLVKEHLATELPVQIKEQIEALSTYKKYHFRHISENLGNEEVSFPLLYLRLASLIYSPTAFLLHLLRWVFPSKRSIAKRHGLQEGSLLLFFYYPLSPLLRLFKKRPL